jgi:acyl transferase domain-containing protein/acyl carrier protein
MDASYWRRHTREAVQFAAGVAAMRDHGCDILLEVGPTPVLGPLALQHPRGAEMTTLASLRPGVDAWQQMLSTLAALYTRGVPVDWEAADRDYVRRRVTLPATPFNRERHWAAKTMVPGGPARTIAAPADHPLLGVRLRSPLRDIQFEAVHSAARPSFLGDHRIKGRVTSPAAAHIVLAMTAVAEAHGWEAPVIDNLSLEQPLVIENGEEAVVQTLLTPDGLDAVTCQVVSRRRDDAEWRVHAAAQIRKSRDAGAGSAVEPGSASPVPGALQSHAGASLYETYAERGLELGGQFRWIEELWNQDGRVHATFRAPRPGDECDRYVLHPGLLDSYFQMASGFLATDDADADAVLWLPVRIGRIEMGHPVKRAVHGYAERVATSSDDGILTAHLRLFDETGALAARIDGLQLRRVSREALRRMSGEDRREWLYRLEWRPAPLPSESQAAEPAHWLIFGAGGATPEAVAARLRALGHTCSQYGEHARPIGQFLARQSDEHPRGPLQLLYLASLDGETRAPDVNPLDQEAAEAAAVLALLQAGAGIATHRRLALWIITRRTQAVRPEDVVLPASSGLWGLGRTIAIEQPESWGGLIDIGPASPQAGAEALLREIDGGGQHVQAAWRDGERVVPSLVRYRAARAGTFAPRSDRTYWITGGLRGLGWLVAERLVASGARSLMLTGRQAPSAATEEGIRALEARGARIVVMTGDVANADDMRSVLGRITAAMPPLAGIFHAAGVLDDDLLIQLTPERIRAVLAPKVAGAWWLHTLTQHLALDAFVLFSSSASVLGAARQGHYAAGNAFLDALAAHRANLGLAALSVNFGPWDEVGMAARHANKTWERAGIARLPPEDTLDLLGELLAEQPTQASVLRVDWQRFLPQFPGGLQGPFFADVRDAVSGHDLTAVREQLLARLEAAPLLERREVLVAFVRESLAQVLGLDSADSVDRDQVLNEMGIDSLMALELTRRLSAAAGTVLPNTLLFNQPTVQALADYLADQVFRLAPSSPAATPAAAPAAPNVEDMIRSEVDLLSASEVSARLEDELRDVEEALRGIE